MSSAVPALCPQGHRLFYDVPEGSCSTLVPLGDGRFGYCTGPCRHVARIAAALGALFDPSISGERACSLAGRVAPSGGGIGASLQEARG
jgi:hypothetical protein